MTTPDKIADRTGTSHSPTDRAEADVTEVDRAEADVTEVDRDLIHELNLALNREVSTMLRYMLQAAKLEGVEWEPLRSTYEDEIEDELSHARYLSNKIVRLGGTPILEPDLTPPADDPLHMVERDVQEEQEDVELYRQLAQKAETEGLIELQLRMEEQAADEARHAEELSRLAG